MRINWETVVPEWPRLSTELENMGIFSVDGMPWGSRKRLGWAVTLRSKFGKTLAHSVKRTLGEAFANAIEGLMTTSARKRLARNRLCLLLHGLPETDRPDWLSAVRIADSRPGEEPALVISTDLGDCLLHVTTSRTVRDRMEADLGRTHVPCLLVNDGSDDDEIVGNALTMVDVLRLELLHALRAQAA